MRIVMFFVSLVVLSCVAYFDAVLTHFHLWMINNRLVVHYVVDLTTEQWVGAVIVHLVLVTVCWMAVSINTHIQVVD